MNAEARPRAIACCVTALLAGIVYFFTAARAPQFGDGMELLASAAISGVPHPTGYPLLMLLLGPIAHGQNAYFLATLLCAMFAVGASVFAALLASESLRNCPGAEGVPLLQPWWPLFWGLLAALSASLWSSATVVEVYSLNALFVTALLFLLLRNVGKPMSLAALVASAFLLGLSGTNHLTSLCFGLLLVVRLAQSKEAVAPSKALVLCIIAGAIGLLPYVYLPLAASGEPPINWGNPQNVESFLWIVSGGDYKRSHFLQLVPGRPMNFVEWLLFAGGRLLFVVQSLGAELLGGSRQLLIGTLPGIGLVVLMIIGVRNWWIGNQEMTGALLACAGLQLLFILTYNIVDIGDYLLGLWATLLPFLISGGLTFLLWASRRLGYLEVPAKQSRLRVAFALLAFIALGANWGAADRSKNNLAAAYTERLIACPPNAIVLTTHDYDIYSAWFAQYVLDERKDLLPVSIQFLRHSWYHEMIPAHAADELGRQVVNPRTGSFRDFDVYRYAEMVSSSVIEPNIGEFPVVMTSGDPTLLGILGQRYQIEPLEPLLTQAEVEFMFQEYPAVAPVQMFQIHQR